MANESNIYADLSTEYLKQIDNGTSIFKSIPDDLGTLVFCGTTEQREAPYSPEEKRKKLLLNIAICAVIILVPWLLISKIGWPIFISIVTLIYLWIRLKHVLKFSGIDDFVGTKGFYIYSFDKKRSNKVDDCKVLFADVSDRVAQIIEQKRNGVYQGSTYTLTLIQTLSEDECKVAYSGSISFNKEYADIQKTFYDAISYQWSEYKKKDLGVIPMRFNLFNIEDGQVRSVFKPIQVYADKMIVLGKEYLYEELKYMGFDKGCLVIEHKNHYVEKKMLGLIKKDQGSIERIPIQAVGDKDFFITYFLLLAKSLGLSKEDIDN